jgi:hypothetical protein
MTTKQKKKKVKKRFVLNRSAPPDYLNAVQFADVFSVGPSTVYDWIESGRVVAIDLPTPDPKSTHKLRRIPVSEVFRLENVRVATAN